MDLERLKTKRSTVRSLFTKLVTKINANIETPLNEEINREIKLEILQDLKCQLVEKIKDLKELDFGIEKVVDISDLEKEIMDSEKYRETGTIVRSKLDRYMTLLERTSSNISDGCTSSEQVSRETETNIIRNSFKTENSVKLPRININTFNGESSEWLDFYNSFEIAIHKNDTLSKIEKFTYLKSYLRGAASTAISGFALTNENYDSAIQLLQDRFGRKELAINAHMTKFLQLETVKSVNNVPALRKLYDNIEIQVRSLQSLGIRTETYSNLFPVILQKVPLEINILYNRQRKCDATDINDLICFLKQEIQSRETAFSMSNSNSFASEPNRRQTLKIHSPQNYPNKSNFNSSHAMLKSSSTEELIIYAFGSEGRKQSFDIVKLKLQSISNSRLSIDIRAAVTDKITHGRISVPSGFVRKIALKKGLILADDGFSTEIDLLIGSDFICEILGDRNLKISKRLMATNSIFGEILQGRINNEGNVKEVQVNYLSTIDQKMDYDQINKFWELENMGINKQESSNSDLQILEKFEENTTYTNGRYETKLLWKDDKIQLSNNYEVAKRRLFNLNDKFKRDKGLYLNYKEIIQQQLKDGIVEFTDCEPNKTCPGYFMPHHAVIRKEKETTKVRICFDASSKSRDQLSLNDLLYCGPNLNPELLRIILKFRIEKIAMCADIQRAFLEIGIKEEDRIYLQFLWGHDNGTCLDLEGQPVRVLRMTRVPFGVNCSPFLLAATIRTHLEKYEHFEVTEKLRDLYVDDFLCSVDNCRGNTSVPIADQKVLGLVWNVNNDSLAIDTSHTQILKVKDINPSKRSMLSTCGMLFDPLGMLSPFTVRLKLLLQNTWERDLKWDDPLPMDIQDTFQSWIDEVDTIPQISLPRNYFSNVETKMAEIHIFSDASQKAYGCVAYFRKGTNDDIFTSFIMAKCRLAPLKKLSLARLELMGALVSARLAEYLSNSFPWITSDNIFFWSDSQIILHWIQGDPLRWKEFVRNRVREIQEKSDPNHWNYCRGKTNPADKLTRGLSIYALVKDEVWWRGPDWLSSSNLQCDTSHNEINSVELTDELRKNYVPENNSVLTVNENNYLYTTVGFPSQRELGRFLLMNEI
ncbi:integrase catalytic domain-containing protein [Trichonephila inaurata madagascariensis]|uniref:Integrase catalytic domain-containing protein n=1 Tax=Trichonephila inaurata madagascariensis TaxID=2747483 RepID=A0A8X7BPP3_9ARAC|nr:integrase catalytic domain-containing protein [Trichonephila inaurata madagascariensis]